MLDGCVMNDKFYQVFNFYIFILICNALYSCINEMECRIVTILHLLFKLLPYFFMTKPISLYLLCSSIVLRYTASSHGFNSR